MVAAVRLLENSGLSCKRDAFELKLTGDVRHDGGLDGVHGATTAPDASSASGHSGAGNPLEKIADPCIPAVGPLSIFKVPFPANIRPARWRKMR